MIPVIIAFLIGIYSILYLISKGNSLRKILYSACVSVMVLFIGMLFYLSNYFERIKNSFINQLEGEGLLKTYSEQFGLQVDENALRQAITITLKLAPAIEFLFSIAGLLLFYVIIQKILNETNIPPLPTINLWRLPNWFLWILMASLVLAFLQNNFSLQIFGYNIVIVCFFAYILQGLGITHFLFLKLNVPIAIRTFIYIFIFLQPFWILFIGLIGILDIWKDFRKVEIQEDR